MEISCLINGYLSENCYIVIKEQKALIIDPGMEKDLLIDKIKELSVTPLAILVTHHHHDHDLIAEDIKDFYKIPIIKFSNKEDCMKIENFEFEVIETPGHTSDSISFKFENDIFSGDFIFRETVGRCDLPTGDFNQMKKSIEMFKKYKENYTLYPGHGPKTTLDREKACNPYFN